MIVDNFMAHIFEPQKINVILYAHTPVTHEPRPSLMKADKSVSAKILLLFMKYIVPILGNLCNEYWYDLCCVCTS